eukprot:4013846-Pleurochrysis_carterae.AAC.3
MRCDCARQYMQDSLIKHGRQTWSLRARDFADTQASCTITQYTAGRGVDYRKAYQVIQGRQGRQ